MYTTEITEDISRFRSEAQHLLLTWEKSSRVWPSKVLHLKEISIANAYVTQSSLKEHANKRTVSLNKYESQVDGGERLKLFMTMSLSEMIVILDEMVDPNLVA